MSPSLFTSDQAFIISDQEYFYHFYLFSLATSTPIYLHSHCCIFTVQISSLPLLKSFPSLFITLRVRSLCMVNASFDDWPLTCCPALSPALSTLYSAPNWINYSHFLEGTTQLLASVPLFIVFPFLNTLLSPLAHLGDSYSFFSTQFNCYLHQQAPCHLLPCLQIVLNTQPSVHHGTWLIS